MLAETKAYKRILLVQPPYSIWFGEPMIAQPPLGLAYIAAVLENDGREVGIIDAPLEGYEQVVRLADGRLRYGLPIERIIERIKAFSPDIVGISCSFSTLFEAVCEIARGIKEYDRDMKVCVGGAHPTAVPEEVLGREEIDFVVIGEGEVRFRQLLDALSTREGLSSIDGLGYKEGGDIRITPPKDYIQDLDDIPFPARHLLDMEKYFEINRPHGVSTAGKRATTIITSRGCPANCIFCSIHGIWGRKFRARSPENVIREIEQLKEKYNIDELLFEDDNLTFDNKRAERIFDLMIEKGFNLYWKTPNGVALWRLTAELIAKMRKSGCYHLSFAIESGSEHVLHKIIRKPLDLKKVKPLIDAAKSNGILTEGFFVMGFPGETFEHMKESFKYALHVGLDKATFMIATPYPGTKLYEDCLKGGFLVDGYDYNRLIPKKANIKTPDFTPEQLEQFVSRAILNFQINKIIRNPGKTIKILVSRLKSDPGNAFKWILKRVKEAL